MKLIFLLSIFPFQALTFIRTRRRPRIETISWNECEDYYEDFYCSNVQVPIDYSNEDSAKIEIAIAKYAAPIQPALKTVVIDLGTSSGREELHIAENFYSTVFNDRVDFIAFDYRGIGDSSGLDCTFDFEDFAPNTVDRNLFHRMGLLRNPPIEKMEEFDMIIKERIEICQEGHEELLKSVSTATIARDLDKIREALGMEKLDVLAAGNGGVLALTYANMFSFRVGRMILEGVPNVQDYFKHSLLE